MRYLLLFFFFYIVSVCPGIAAEISGYIEHEIRAFHHPPVYDKQHNGPNLSFAIEPEFYYRWNDGHQDIKFVPFFRIDQHDTKRTHFDIRELSFYKSFERWEMQIGVNKVFWGVTESQHLVDIINQTDLIEETDQESKLGQPMFNFTLLQDWGIIDLFILPYFRKRTFPGEDGRLRTQFVVDTDHVKYESNSKERHIDWAIRWSHNIREFDVGISHFSGTSREPRLVPSVDDLHNIRLTPLYDLIEQTSLDLQWTHESWLWKLETINRFGQEDRFIALTGGFEYTFVGVFNSDMDIGVLSEYLFDERKDNASVPFENDLFAGIRFVLNDIQGTEMLVYTIHDLHNDGSLFNIEYSHRIGEDLKLNIEVQTFNNIPESDPLLGFRRDDFIQLTLDYYF